MKFIARAMIWFRLMIEVESEDRTNESQKFYFTPNFHSLQNLAINTLPFFLVILFCTGFKNHLSASSIEDAWSRDTARINELILKAKDNCAHDYAKAMYYLQQAQTASRKIHFEKGIADADLYYGIVHYYLDEREISLEYLEKAHLVYKRIKSDHGLTEYYMALSRVYKLHKEYVKAMEALQQALQIAERRDNETHKSKCLNGLAVLLIEEGNYEVALNYAQQALQLKQKLNDTIGIAVVQNTLGSVHEHQGLLDKALTNYESALRIRRELGYKRHIAHSLITISSLNLQLSRIDIAKKQLFEVLPIYEELDEKTGMIYVYLQLSDAFLAEKNLEETRIYANKALNLSERIPNLSLIHEAYERLIKLEEASKNFEVAFRLQKKYQQAGDSIFTLERERDFNELELKFDSERKEHAIALLESQTASQKRVLIFFSALIASLIVLASSLFYIFRQKSTLLHRNQQLLEKEKIIHKQNVLLKEKEANVLKDKLETRSRELTSRVLTMQRTYESIESLSTRLNDLSTKINGQDHQVKEINLISNELERLAQNDLWDEFDEVFKTVHNDFYDKLLEAHHNLTPTEIKIAALLRMNLNTKDIAAMTFKSESGIKSARFRLRKKLGLTTEDGLVAFLMKL